MKTFSYADGSGNTYRITPTDIHFVPITKEMSSSGVYSGGFKKNVSITNEVFGKISSLCEDAAVNKSSHIKNRMMTSGRLRIIEEDSGTSYILSPSSKEKKALETLLRSIVKPEVKE